MKHKSFILLLSLLAILFSCAPKPTDNSVIFFPANGAKEVNPDTQLKITFAEESTLGNKGVIRIYEAGTNRLVESLDMSIPAGPDQSNPDMIRKKAADYTKEPYVYETTNYTNANTVPGTPSGLAMRDTTLYQLTIIGRFTDGFRFYPIIIREHTATIYPHHNLLEYGKEYYVTIDSGVLSTEKNDFQGIQSNAVWRFKTKKKAPAATARKLIVSADGSGDFNTVQGAMDFIPDFSKERYEVFIKNGNYEELVYFRNKQNVTLKGESREGVVVHYANNETFNPHPINLKTNEWPGTFPSRRAAFAADNCYDLRFEDMTIQTTLKGQAEGLLIMGERNYLKNVHIIGSGDALQANGSVYLENCRIDGDGDTILGRGPGYYSNCTLYSRGPFMWIRNTDANHGNVFVNCAFYGQGNGAVIARTSANHGKGYPYSEAVLINCTLDNIKPEGWGGISGNTSHLHYWEYNSRTTDGNPVDVSQRHPLSRQLSAEKDGELIRNYTNPEFVLGWKPEI
ncbi:carbohydrate esterase [Bacteroides sp. 214]|uniref:pectinesterase family protein n=1 Tax=Bacteroides sp. 214 TaxID=2302935 RepID=UPI0013D736E6|nr:pectinesterase family protein [Bacteroides sp. 214]NDW11877.1 carbohydrate esterase [Bacteroides sp. 214]